MCYPFGDFDCFANARCIAYVPTLRKEAQEPANFGTIESTNKKRASGLMPALRARNQTGVRKISSCAWVSGPRTTESLCQTNVAGTIRMPIVVSRPPTRANEALGI
jgi:hypothetical protein